VTVGEPTAGTVVILANREVQYTPPLDFYGTATFGYVAVDEVGQQGEGTVTVVVHPTGDPPSPPSIVSAPASADVYSASEEVLTITWEPSTDPDGDAPTYTWRLFNPLNWSTPLMEMETGSETHVEIPVAALVPVVEDLLVPWGGFRVLRHVVRASDGVLASAGPSRAINLVWLEGAEPPPPPLPPATTFALRGPFPNPASGSSPSRFTLALPEDADVHLALYDLLGRAMGTFEARLEAGSERHFAVETGRLAAGLYFYRLRVRHDGEVTHASGRLAVLD
jgi:hypothetical protein